MSITISQLMKQSNSGQRYNDNVFHFNVHSLGLKLSPRDIEELKAIMGVGKQA